MGCRCHVQLSLVALASYSAHDWPDREARGPRPLALLTRPERREQDMHLVPRCAGAAAPESACCALRAPAGATVTERGRCRRHGPKAPCRLGHRPPGAMSMNSRRERKPTPRCSSISTVSMRWRSERPSRSRRQAPGDEDVPRTRWISSVGLKAPSRHPSSGNELHALRSRGPSVSRKRVCMPQVTGASGSRSSRATTAA